MALLARVCLQLVFIVHAVWNIIPVDIAGRMPKQGGPCHWNFFFIPDCHVCAVR